MRERSLKKCEINFWSKNFKNEFLGSLLNFRTLSQILVVKTIKVCSNNFKNSNILLMTQKS